MRSIVAARQGPVHPLELAGVPARTVFRLLPQVIVANNFDDMDVWVFVRTIRSGHAADAGRIAASIACRVMRVHFGGRTAEMHHERSDTPAWHWPSEQHSSGGGSLLFAGLLGLTSALFAAENVSHISFRCYLLHPGVLGIVLVMWLPLFTVSAVMYKQFELSWSPLPCAMVRQSGFATTARYVHTVRLRQDLSCAARTLGL